MTVLDLLKKRKWDEGIALVEKEIIKLDKKSEEKA
jgi:hypothetical protein